MFYFRLNHNMKKQIEIIFFIKSVVFNGPKGCTQAQKSVTEVILVHAHVSRLTHALHQVNEQVSRLAAVECVMLPW